MERILNKENEIKAQLLEQKAILYESLYILKEKEEMKKHKCFCRGLFCRIMNSRYRWSPSQSDTLLNKIKTLNSQTINKLKIQFECCECKVEFGDEGVLKNHKLSNHEPDYFECNECDDKFIDAETLKTQ